MRTPANGDQRKVTRGPTDKSRPKNAKLRLNREQASDAKSRSRRVKTRAIDALQGKFPVEDVMHRQGEVWEYCVEDVHIERETPPDLVQKALTELGIDVDLHGVTVLYCLVQPTEKRASKSRVAAWVREFQARHGRKPQIPEVQAQFQLPKTTAWRRIKAA